MVRRAWLPYLIGALLPGMALVLRDAVFAELPLGVPPLFLYPAVVLATLAGGSRAGLTATGLSLVATATARLGQPGPSDQMAWLDLALFAATGTLLSCLGRSRDGGGAASGAAGQWGQAFDALPDLVALVDTDYRIVRVNRAMAARLGVPVERCVGRPCYEIFHASGEPPASCPHALTCQDGQPHSHDLAEPRLGGEFLETATPLFDSHGALVGAALLARDITDRKRAETQLQAALREREEALTTNRALLREVHHRVKNNLQMLADMLYLQLETLPGTAAAPLQDAHGRVYAIAQLHEHLYQSMDGGRVNVAEYLGRLVQSFGDLYRHLPVCLDVSAPDLCLDLDRAVHVGLILNELLTNAAKHGFPAGGPAMAGARLRQRGDMLELHVWDTGVGLREAVNFAESKSLGLRIVRALAARLGATVEIANEGGARFTLTFPAGESLAVVG